MDYSKEIAKLLYAIQVAADSLAPPSTRDVPYKGEWNRVRIQARELAEALRWTRADIQVEAGMILRNK